MRAPRRLRPRLSRRARDGRGAVAVMVALLVVVLFAAAALGVDIASQMTSKQSLRDTMDAAAHAGAYELPANGAGAAAAATTMARAADAGADPVTDLWCVVASTGTPPAVATSQIPSTCNPGPPPYTTGNYPGMRCGDTICAIPCIPAEGDQCNTVRVADSKAVPYAFAPVIGYDEGSTGEVVSVACKGSCGSEVPNPMDVAVVADRTGSMSSTDVTSMINGIKAMLTVMTPSQQYVSLGSIGPAKNNAATTTSTTCRSDPYSGGLSANGTSWRWMSLPFHDDYLTAAATPTVNPGSDLVKAITCLNRSSSTGTHLAAPMKAAARYLLGHDTNNLASLPARTGTPKKVLIFETDGQPNEQFTNSSTPLTGTAYPGNPNGSTACSNLGSVASNAKDEDILIITVAYNLSTQRCAGSSGPTVTGTLAAAASPDSNGNASDADNSCGNATLRATENADGDFFFCAASGDDMANVFRTAIGSAGGGIRLIRLP